MSGFPGPPGYSEVLAAQERARREEARSEAEYPVVERSAEQHDLWDEVWAHRLSIIGSAPRTAALLERVLERVGVMNREIERLRQEARQQPEQGRKEGTDDSR